MLTPLAERGDASALNALGAMYEGGNGVPQDYSRALTFYEKAADQGFVQAMVNLGWHYWSVTSPDFVHAHMWFNIAASQGDPVAIGNPDTVVLRPWPEQIALAEKSARDDVASLMTPAQIAEAQKLASDWVAAHPKRQ